MSKKAKQNNSIPLATLVAFAALGVPRVIVHDLHLISLDGIGYTVLAVAPILAWLGYALLVKTSHPFRDLFLLGLFFGLLLATAHQITWDASWGSNPPHVGGNLAGKLNPLVESALLRSAAVISSIATGAVAGVLLGVIASGRTKLIKK